MESQMDQEELFRIHYYTISEIESLIQRVDEMIRENPLLSLLEIKKKLSEIVANFKIP